MPQLAISDLRKSYGRTVAVDDVSFNVSGGEIVGLLGPNGAGKSTTFLCAAGLLRPDYGTFSWDGRELGSKRGQNIALISETPDVYPMLTVWEHLVFVAKSCRLDGAWEDRAQGLITRLELADKRDELGESLSKGMRQKTLIACTVLADSPVVMLDEPMIGLDPRGQRELREMIVELRNTGRSIVMSTHMIESAQVLCDRLIIMKSGAAIASGPIAELRARVPNGRTLEDVFLEITA